MIRLHTDRSERGLTYPEGPTVSIHGYVVLYDLGGLETAKVLAHELCHVATLSAKDRDPHGGSFRRWMQDIGVDPDSNSVIDGSPFAKWWAARKPAGLHLHHPPYSEHSEAR